MNLLDRANSFLKGSGRKLALTVVPLAILAAPAAKAVTTVPSLPPVFNLVFSGWSASGGATVSGGGNLGAEPLPVYNRIQGISLYSDETVGDLFCFGSGCSGNLRFSWEGDFGTGPWPSSGTPIPVHWEFTASPEFSWTVSYNVGLGTTVSDSGSAASGSTVSGSDTVTAGGSDYWSASILLSWNTDGEGSFSAIVPQGRSDDLNSTPEPASLLLIGPGLGLLLLKRRYARRTT